MSEQCGQRIDECDVKKMDDMCETKAKPQVDVSVAGLSPVCTVVQSEARLTVSANTLPTPGQVESAKQVYLLWTYVLDSMSVPS